MAAVGHEVIMNQPPATSGLHTRVGSTRVAAHLPLPSAPLRPRARAPDGSGRVELGGAARAAGRRVRAGARRAGRTSRTRSRSRAAPRRCTSPWSCSASARATRSPAPPSPSRRARIRFVYAGATPVFVDADAATWTIDPALLDHALAERPRIRGGDRRRPLRSVLRLRRASRRSATGAGVALIQDATESLGATYRDAPGGRPGRSRPRSRSTATR